jgi:antitoxin component YwqK of YwqJK toxin-antitoxin module
VNYENGQIILNSLFKFYELGENNENGKIMGEIRKKNGVINRDKIKLRDNQKQILNMNL